MLENPFVFGEVALGDSFADRESELKGLVADLTQNSRIFLISPRRYGKTSLVCNALAKLEEQGIPAIRLDLYQITSLEQFPAFYAKAMAQTLETSLEGAEIDPQGSLSVSVEAAPSGRESLLHLKHAIDQPEAIAQRKGTRMVVFFDEFQEILTLGGESLEKFLRAAIQHHHCVSYVFAGSKQHVLADMVSKRSRAFYKMGKVQFLGKIPRREFAAFIAAQFSRTGFTVEEGVPELILETANDVPYYVQYLCHELWNSRRDDKAALKAHIPETVRRIVNSQTPAYTTIWDGLSLGQRRLLQALAEYGGKGIFSHPFLRRANLAPASSVQTAVKLLIKKDILQKEDGEYSFTDAWFKEWVRAMARTPRMETPPPGTI